MSRDTNEGMSPEVRGALNNPASRHLVIGAMLMRQDREARSNAKSTKSESKANPGGPKP